MASRLDFSRRLFVGGLAAISAAGITPAVARTPLISLTRRELFTAKSSDGVALACEAQGDPNAPEILFIHGIRQSGLSWSRQFADPALAGLRMVRFDLRGHGDSEKPTSPAAYSNPGLWGDDVAAVIATAQLRRPVVVAWSLGGMVAGGYLIRTGGRALAGINLVDAVTKVSADFLTPLSADFGQRTSSHDLTVRSAATAAFFRACYERPPRGRELEAMLTVNGMTAREVTEGLSRMMVDLDPAYESYKGPMLISHGQRDRLVRVAMSQHNLEIHPGATLSLYPTAGHSPFYDDAPRFNRELASFAIHRTRDL